MPESFSYVGRFAPTPSGPLHFGSIVAALGSFLDARSQAGKWLVRIDDLDPPRVQVRASESILPTLERLGLYWDGPIIYQSDRNDAYTAGIEELEHQGLLYPCICPSKLTKGLPYPGTCRHRYESPNERHSIRIKTHNLPISIEDQLQGRFSKCIESEIGDFNVRRSDQLFAYHLAAVIDDSWQGVTNIVRGMDLLESTICQVYLQDKLGIPQPTYCHLPIALNSNGQKFSKQHFAKDVLLNNQPEIILFCILEFLGQKPDSSLGGETVEDIIKWGVENWDAEKLPVKQEIKIDEQ